MVDHMTENYCNSTVFAKRKLQNDGLDNLEYIIFKMLELGMKPKLSKGDVSKACRRLPTKVEDIPFTAVFCIQLQGRAVRVHTLGHAFRSGWQRVGLPQNCKLGAGFRASALQVPTAQIC